MPWASRGSSFPARPCSRSSISLPQTSGHGYDLSRPSHAKADRVSQQPFGRYPVNRSMRTLLLADDNVTVQRVIALTFAGEAIQVVSVADGNQAMEKMA